jgi:hypothetical protein
VRGRHHGLLADCWFLALRADGEWDAEEALLDTRFAMHTLFDTVKDMLSTVKTL